MPPSTSLLGRGIEPDLPRRIDDRAFAGGKHLRDANRLRIGADRGRGPVGRDHGDGHGTVPGRGVLRNDHRGRRGANSTTARRDRRPLSSVADRVDASRRAARGLGPSRAAAYDAALVAALRHDGRRHRGRAAPAIDPPQRTREQQDADPYRRVRRSIPKEDDAFTQGPRPRPRTGSRSAEERDPALAGPRGIPRVGRPRCRRALVVGLWPEEAFRRSASTSISVCTWPSRPRSRCSSSRWPTTRSSSVPERRRRLPRRDVADRSVRGSPAGAALIVDYVLTIRDLHRERHGRDVQPDAGRLAAAQALRGAAARARADRAQPARHERIHQDPAADLPRVRRHARDPDRLRIAAHAGGLPSLVPDTLAETGHLARETSWVFVRRCS